VLVSHCAGRNGNIVSLSPNFCVIDLSYDKFLEACLVTYRQPSCTQSDGTRHLGVTTIVKCSSRLRDLSFAHIALMQSGSGKSSLFVALVDVYGCGLGFGTRLFHCKQWRS